MASSKRYQRTLKQLPHGEIEMKRFLLLLKESSLVIHGVGLNPTRSALLDFLVSMGVPRSRIEVRGYGPDRPLPGTGRTSPQNRRVEAVRVS